jgi:hypothetical protein
VTAPLDAPTQERVQCSEAQAERAIAMQDRLHDNAQVACSMTVFAPALVAVPSATPGCFSLRLDRHSYHDVTFHMRNADLAKDLVAAINDVVEAHNRRAISKAKGRADV